MAERTRAGGGRHWRYLRAHAIRTQPLECVHCGKPLDPDAPFRTPNAIEADHIVPVAAGGKDVVENIQLSLLPV